MFHDLLVLLVHLSYFGLLLAELALRGAGASLAAVSASVVRLATWLLGLQSEFARQAWLRGLLAEHLLLLVIVLIRAITSAAMSSVVVVALNARLLQLVWST